MPTGITKVKVTQNGVTTTYVVTSGAVTSTGTGADKILTFHGKILNDADEGDVEIHVDHKDIVYVS